MTSLYGNVSIVNFIKNYLKEKSYHIDQSPLPFKRRAVLSFDENNNSFDIQEESPERDLEFQDIEKRVILELNALEMSVYQAIMNENIARSHDRIRKSFNINERKYTKIIKKIRKLFVKYRKM